MWTQTENSLDQACPERSQALLHLQSEPCSGSCTEQILLDGSTICASARLGACSFGMHKKNSNDKRYYLSPRDKATSLGVQCLIIRCRYRILVIISMTVQSTTTLQTQPSTVCRALLTHQCQVEHINSQWQKSCGPRVRPSHVAHYLQKEHLTNIVSAYQAHHF